MNNKMRIAWYAGASAALATAVVASAFYQRANFYSAMVHLSQSNLSVMVLVNLVFVVYSTLIYFLQRLCFGPLRPAEIEQLYEKGWFAITETCLAMTIFRDEIGAFFLIMFTALVTGKVWGWIGEGRVEVLEQQPPANPVWFHTRLSFSLLVSIAYDMWLLAYIVRTVVEEARPTMMVMFLFEFAVLTVSSLHTAARYIVSLVEMRIVKTQTHQRLQERRRRVREQRDEILRRREAGDAAAQNEELPDPDEVDEMDIEVPGWEAKGQWVLSLDLFTDFVKLSIYTAFFSILVTFYGLPIHIMRDWFMTTRSFLKRLHALVRYRQALKHMSQYPDATAEDLGREDTCIICREEMRPWNPADPTQVERSRAKKLPCGHVLHFGCLKSWLERQQVCPTCRRPVAQEGQQQAAPANGGPAMVLRLGLGFPAGQNQPAQPAANGQAAPGGGQAAPGGGQAAPGGGQPAPGGAGGEHQPNQDRNVRMFNLGPIRLGFAQGGVNEMQALAQRLQMEAGAANPPAAPPLAAAVPVPRQDGNDLNASLEQIRGQLQTLSQQVRQEMTSLHNAAQELQVMTLLMNELARLRQLQQQAPQGQPSTTQPAAPAQHQTIVVHPPLIVPPAPAPTQLTASRPLVTRHIASGTGVAIPSGSPDLPEGVVIPPGWSLLPLQRVGPDVVTPDPTTTTTTAAAAPPPPPSSSTTTQNAHSPAQEMLRSIFAHQPRSRGTSPAPGSSLRPGAPGPAESSRRPGSRGSGASSAEPAARRQPPLVPAAPIPVAPPNWGGPGQLFGGGGGGDRAVSGPMFGYQIEPRQDGAHDEAGDEGNSSTNNTASDNSTPEEEEMTAAAVTGVNGVAAGDGNTAAHVDAEEAGGNGSSGGDRRPRAVTVEEADEEDETER
ncbi:hypothetical protein VTJ83DRAFT_3387 [Remersonia thermophila]|uniref:RING-type E3 ubiquitin transferase n=1 Tax=Remersonia thermophila TaxID=72144 RepID=A0ABR4DE06_9PEZI